MRHLVLFFGVLIVGTALSVRSNAATYDWSAGPLPKVKLETAAFRGWVPDTAEPLAGVLVLIPGRHGDGRGMADDARWQQLATEVGFAIIACQFANGDPGMYQNDPDGTVSRAINDAVAELSTLASKPELKSPPLAFWGTSAGSNVSTCYIKFFPERVAAFASSKGTWGPGGATSGKCLEVPMIFAIGSADNPDWVKPSVTTIEKVQGKAPFTLALHPTEGHGVDKSLDVAIPFLESTIKQRLGKTSASASGTPSIFKSELPKIGSSSTPTSSTAKPVLNKIVLREGWLGDPKTYEVAPYKDFKGSKTSAIWLPDEKTALAWQAYLKG